MRSQGLVNEYMTLDEFQRELLIWGLTEDGVKAVRQFAEKNQQALGLEKWGSGELDLSADSTWRRAWIQKDLSKSRKQVEPLLRKAME